MEDNIPGFPGYHISKEGKLYNKGHPVKTFYHKRYERTKLRNGNLSKNVKIHRLVAEAYIPNPNNLPVVMHLNNIRTDNRAENLKWGTQKENTQQCIQEGRFYFHGGYNKISPRKIRRIIRCLRLHRYTTIRGLCQKFKISKPALYRIKKTYFL